VSGRHSGGVQGTVLWRGYCPVCRRGVAGGNTSRPPGQQISLRPHKTDPRHPGSPWCGGGGSHVPADRDLMHAWAVQMRLRAERRDERQRARSARL
jgi:hypothetical protein